jgi:5-methylcytosine-specific restriction protein B
MARFNPHQKSAAVYPVVSDFADRCLLQDGSILQPDLQLWTAENLAELDRTFVQNPDEGTDSYYQKLEQQISVDFHPELSRFFHREVSHL